MATGKKISKITKFMPIIIIAAILFAVYFSTSDNIAKFSAAMGGRIGRSATPSLPGTSSGQGISMRLVEICTDNIDNDRDGNIDCADSDCTGKACTNKYIICPSGSVGGGPEKICTGDTQTLNLNVKSCVKNAAAICVETSCGDTKDNELDGWPDCQDTDCIGQLCNFAQCPQGTMGGGIERACSAGGALAGSCKVITRNDCSETTCNDAVDNDADHKTDCQDVDCDKIGLYNRCEFGKELTCDDGFDNDADGKIDGKDLDDCYFDLVPIGVTKIGSYVNDSKTIYIFSLSFKNIGIATPHSFFSNSLYNNADNSYAAVCSLNVIQLGEITSCRADSLVDIAAGNRKLIVDIWNEIPESNESNNVGVY